MPVTRSTVRVCENTEEATVDMNKAEGLASPYLEIERAPLTEISNSNNSYKPLQAVGSSAPLSNIKLARSPPSRTAKPISWINAEVHLEECVLEDDDLSETSSATEEACRELRQSTLSPKANRGQVRHPDKSTTPSSKAVRRARKQLSPQAKRPRSPPASSRPLRSTVSSQHAALSKYGITIDCVDLPQLTSVSLSETTVSKAEQEAVDIGISESSGKMQAMSVRSQNALSSADMPMSRSARLEDSIDALDAMEDMLDEVRESLASVDQPDSTEASLGQNHSGHGSLVNRSPPALPHTSEISLDKPGRSESTAKNEEEKNTSPAPQNTVQRAVDVRGSSRPASKLSGRDVVISRNGSEAGRVKSSKAPTKPIDIFAKPPRVVASLNKKPFTPVKSSKPPTTSTFSLPGDAVAARIKAEREARQNGNAASDGNEKPKPHSSGPEVRMTVAAMARLQIARGGRPTSPAQTRHALKNKAQVSRTASPTIRAPSGAGKAAGRPGMHGMEAAQRSTTLSTSQPAATTGVKRNVLPMGVTGARVDTGLKRRPSSGDSSSSTITGQPASKRPATAATVISPVQRAEAARRARAEAAERGRQASKLWAEKMKKRNSISVNETAVEPSI